MGVQQSLGLVMLQLDHTSTSDLFYSHLSQLTVRE